MRQSAPYGPYNTFTNFHAPDASDQSRIDFVMLAGKEGKAYANTGMARGGWQTTRYAVIDNFVENDIDGWEGRWSDHRAVRASLQRV